MRKFFTAISFSLICFIALGQNNNSCYLKYVKVFEVRGANPVKDGTHEGVIITIRKDRFADCFLGKVKVVDGLVDKNSIQLSFVDDTYEPFRRAYKSKENVGVVNGISQTMVTKDEELINIMFTNAVKPKKKEFKRAPEPSFDL